MALILLSFFLCSTSFAQDGSVVNTSFCGLNDTDSSATLLNCEAQSSLNTEANLQGTAILKRHGFSQTAALTVATAPISGAYQFIDKSGNVQVIVCHAQYCANSVNSGNFTNFITTASYPGRWSFVDYNGVVYGVNDKGDQPFSYDGTTLTQPFSPSVSNGTLIELSKDRLDISGVSANPNVVYHSQSGVFTNFTTGPQASDPWTDTFGGTGDKVTAIKYDRGREYVFKRQSITACLLADQYSTTCWPISNSIGTNSPASIVGAPGGIYFQSQNGSFWQITDYGLFLLSQKISNLVKSQTSQYGGNGNGLNNQTGQASWNAGTQFPLSSWNTVSHVGSIFNSSITFTDNTTTNFGLGTFTTNSTATTNSVYVYNTTSTVWIDAGAETAIVNANGGGGPNWKDTGTGNGVKVFAVAGSGSDASACVVSLGPTTYLQPKFGSAFWATSQTGNSCGRSFTINLLDNNNAVQNTQTISMDGTADAAWIYKKIDTSGMTSPTVALQFTRTDSGGTITFTSSQVVRGINIPLWVSNCPSFTGNCGFAFDLDETIPISSSGIYTSRCFDTTYSTPTYGALGVAISSDPLNSRLNFQTQTTTSCTGAFNGASAYTLGNVLTSQQRATIYIATFTIASATSTPAQFTSVSLAAATTGQFFTQCIQPGNNVTSWGQLNCATTNLGAGSEVFYATATAYSCSSLPTTPPKWPDGSGALNWTQTTNNAKLALNTSSTTAVYIGWVSLLGSATDQAQVDACTLNWNNGTVPQPTFGTYDPIKNAVYWTTAINNSATNNRTIKYDLNLASLGMTPWFPFDIQATALRMINNQLYFGSSVGGTWNAYAGSGVDSDNGMAINSFWQSKDFGGADPFKESIWQRTFVVARNIGSGNVTSTLTNSLGASDAYTISLATTSTLNYVRAGHRNIVTSGAPFMNIKFSNNAVGNPWEANGFKLDYYTQPWSIQNP